MHDQNQKTSGVSGALMSMFRIMKLGMTIVYLKFLIERMVSMSILLVHETQLENSRIYKRRLKLEKMSQKGQMLTLEKLSKSVVSLANQSELILTIVYTKLENVSCFTSWV